MISAENIRNKIQKHKDIAEEKLRAEEQKNKQDKINKEMLEVEKAINEFDDNIGKHGFDLEKNIYIRVPIMVSRDVQDILNNEGYFVMKIHNRIANNETRLYFNEKDYKRDLYKHDDLINPQINRGTLKSTPSKLITELNNSDSKDECTVTKDDEIEGFWNEFINNSNWKVYRIN